MAARAPMAAVDPVAAPAELPAPVAPAYRLTALSVLAKTFTGGYAGGPDLILRPSAGELKVGRRVSSREGFCLPPEWVQVSGNHCQLKWDPARGTFVVIDSSTNGTYVVRGMRMERVPRGEAYPLQPGDLLRLSFTQEQDSAKQLEYCFEPLISSPDMEEANAAGSPQRKEPLASVGNNLHSAGAAPAAKRRRAASPDHFQAADALAQLQKVNQDLQRKVEASREQLKAAEERAAADVAALQEQLAQARRAAEDAAAVEREKAESHAEAATASYKNALETMKGNMAALEEQLAQQTGKAEEMEAAAEASSAERAEAQAALAKAAEERQQVEAALQRKVDKLEEADTAFKEEVKELKSKLSAAVTKLTDLQHQLDMEKASGAHAEHLRREAAEALEHAKLLRQREEQGRGAAEEAQAKLKQELDEAIRQNERAEERRDQALGASAVQQAYLQQVLSIASSLNAARHVEEAARAKAEAARDEADQSLLTLQRQVVTALNPDMDAAHVEEYMKQMQSNYEAEEATQRSKSVGYTGTPREEEAQSGEQADMGFDPEATQLEVTPSKFLHFARQDFAAHPSPGHADTASAATGSTACEARAAAAPAEPPQEGGAQPEQPQEAGGNGDGDEAMPAAQPGRGTAGATEAAAAGATEAAASAPAPEPEGAPAEVAERAADGDDRATAAAEQPPIEYLTVDESEVQLEEELTVWGEEAEEGEAAGTGAVKAEVAEGDELEEMEEGGEGEGAGRVAREEERESRNDLEDME
eukprot:jgi/Tetstr1/460657/TSEL_005853.t1